MNRIKYILFDAANTLIHKPTIWECFDKALKSNNIEMPIDLLKRNHKLISEIIHFPDATSSEFYQKFNAELLYSLGIIPNEKLLEDIFQACTYQPWQPFNDTVALNGLDFPKGILSNFNASLSKKINEMFPDTFSDFFISEVIQFAKPDLRFYRKAIELLRIEPNEVLYIGDSIKLDMEPARVIGMNSILIDRDGVFPNFNARISSLSELNQIIG
ncbi:HAD family hydrolase [Flavisolibacter tropicus]|uniref:Haloacid dehalogenase n=1 Tax=Flavisolibacter tropicus TaxID=1492898 RepID=A0A172U000_9BACT|nr:HAD family hydrolase [Flavisolibacter tropicus]ANE52444.1 hypothetical protein SY85_20115 [Flavisolibacter tropicus]